jgi:hypothetical protein
MTYFIGNKQGVPKQKAKSCFPAERSRLPFCVPCSIYRRLEERGGGVCVESRSISLSRTPPLGLGWLFNPIISSLPGGSLSRLLIATRKAVLSRQHAGTP